MERKLEKMLRQLGVKVPANYLREYLHSHPDYPSTLSLTDTLLHLGIPHAAVKIDKNQLPEIPVPFLAHIKNQESEDFILVDNLKKLRYRHPTFLTDWDGIVIMAEKPGPGPHQATIPKKQEIEKNQKMRLGILGATGLIVCFMLIMMDDSWLERMKDIVLLGGLVIGILLIMQETGRKNPVAELFCGKNTDCQHVLQSKNIKLPWGIKLSDLAIGFFSGLLLLRIVSQLSFHPEFNSSSSTLLAFLSLSVLPLVIFLIGYQAFALKNWCRLCLILSAILIILAVLGVMNFQTVWSLDPGKSLMLTAIFLLPGSAWLNSRYAMDELHSMQQKQIGLLKFKRNQELFLSHLLNQKPIEIRTNKGDILMGDAEAPIQLTVACSPHCKPCAQAHQLLEQLLEKTNSGFGLCVRFALGNKHPEDINYRAAAAVLQSGQLYAPEKVIADWYRKMDLEWFEGRYPCGETNQDVRQTLITHKNWAEKIGIAFTPTLFINGYRLKKPYEIADLPEYWNILQEAFCPEPVE